MGAIICGVIEGSVVGVEESETLRNLMVFQITSSEETFGILQFVGAIPTFFTGLFQVLMLDFAFFDGPWQWVRWIMLVPIIGTIVFGLVILFFGIFQRTI